MFWKEIIREAPFHLEYIAGYYQSDLPQTLHRIDSDAKLSGHVLPSFSLLDLLGLDGVEGT
jgi:hypothetical protein